MRRLLGVKRYTSLWAGDNPQRQYVFWDSAVRNSVTHFGQCSPGKVAGKVYMFWYKCYISGTWKRFVKSKLSKAIPPSLPLLR